MNFYKNLLLTLLIVIPSILIAQSEAEGSFDVNKDIDLMRVYERYVADGYGAPDIYKKLAYGYYFRSEYLIAKQWFEKWFESGIPEDETALFRYNQTLKALQFNAANSQTITILEPEDGN